MIFQFMAQKRALVKRSSTAFIVLLFSTLLIVMGAWAQVAGDSTHHDLLTTTRTTTLIESSAISKHIKYLASDELQGRRSGTPGCQLAADYITKQFQSYGLQPSNKGKYLQPFEFIAGVKYSAQNHLLAKIGGQASEFKLSTDYLPFNFSSSGSVTSGVVLAGFGISAPALGYDDYAQIDVKDKVVMVLPFGPEGNNSQGKYGEYLGFRRKALAAREHGAKAILFISEADTLTDIKGREEGNYADSGIIALRISKQVANQFLKSAAKNFDDLQKEAASANLASRLTLDKVTIDLNSEVSREMQTTDNVIGWLEGSDEKLKNEYIVIGAHYDHLGMGGPESLANGVQAIHHGADDNASGVAGLLELARALAANKSQLRRSVIFAAFSGEELGLLGSSHYVKQPLFPLNQTMAMLNMDMIGRMRNDTLVVGGIGTSPQWKPLVEDLNQMRGFVLKFQDDGYGPSDHSSFYGKDIPVLFFFTGVHDDYHKPSDTAEHINVISEQAIVSLMQDIATKISNQDSKIEFTRAKAEGERRNMNSSFRVYMGSVPEYSEQVQGVKLSGTRPGSPAEKAGLKAGDIIIKLAGRDVRSVYDYTYVLQDLKPNETVEVIVTRDGKPVTLQITPTPRQ